MLQVEINTDTRTKQSITIDNNSYFIELAWTGLFWNLSLLYSDNTRVVANVKVVPNFPLLSFSGRSKMAKINKQLVRFRGEIVVTLSDYSRELKADDFVTGRAKLFVVEGDELDALLAKNS